MKRLKHCAKMLFITGGIWVVLSLVIIRTKIVDPFFFPDPKATLVGFYALITDGFARDILATIKRTLIACTLAISIGIPIGLILGRKESWYRNVEFFIDFFRSMPATALFPLAMLLLGINDAPKIAVAACAAGLLILFNTAYGIIHGKKTRILAAQLMGASSLQIFKHILVWESLPQIAVGVRTGVSLSLAIIIVTEMFIGTSFGIGRRIIDMQVVFNIPAMYAAIITAGLVGFILNYIITQGEHHLIHWTRE